MIRTYCDNCGKEMTGPLDPALIGQLTLPARILTTRVKIQLKLQNAMKDHGYGTDRDLEHVCFGCIADAVAAADKREKPATPPPTNAQIEAYLRAGNK